MKIRLNGTEYETGETADLAGLLERLDVAGGRVAVMLDDQVVRKSRLAQTRLSPDCRVEVVQMVGGG